MSQYLFAPSPTFGVSEHPFTTWREAFTRDEINAIITHAENIRLVAATLGEGEEKAPANIRVSKTAWISQTSEISWLYDRLGYIARQINGQFYKFNLHGFYEDFQFTVYEGDEESHYTWHTDAGPSGNGAPPRKLSMVMQLTDPSEYEGGNLEVLTGPTPTVVDKEFGLIAAFPSYVLHRVTPVTKGLRRTLVVWVTGPAFL
jgi:PKHD-type hydroxylase